MNLQVDLNTIITILGMLSTVIIILVRIKPGLDDYFRKGTPILAEIDDVIDAILLEFPNNKALNTIDKVLDKLLLELKEAGYKLDYEDRKKVENRLKARLRREGFELKLDKESRQYKVLFKAE